MNGSNKLWIDDIRPAPDLTWTRVKTISEAIRAINTFDYDVISIDHDISHQVTIGESSRPHPCNEDFSCVCYFIGLKYKHYVGHHNDDGRPKIYLHTANPVGAFRMQSILKDFGLESEIVKSFPANRLEMEL